MNALGARLYLPAKQFFKLANDAKVMAILVGGGASRLNGSNRFTKDLDINVSSFSFLKSYKGDDFLIRQGSSRRMMVVTYKSTDRDLSVRCDVGLHTDIERLLPYTKVDEASGISWDSPKMPQELKHLLLSKDVVDAFWQQIRSNHPDQGNFLDAFVRPIIE
ncbi:hypothetical protein PNOK_0420900 [Pyrrhoderma noxium]|uniref:Uncharacterized protein n=1 Tax=Pyrrhoderma noxium TaxID=2282107 RepID=A0A286UI23_9AGAM|nr:hypothetical protein PNOK_0420900 [Pyrrhoderma noxium]